MVDWAAAQAAVHVVSGKWVIPIITTLAAGPRTHTELHRGIGPVSSKVLTDTLRRMRTAGLLNRRPRLDAATGGAYELTDCTRQLLPILAAMGAWHTGATTRSSVLKRR